MAELIKHGSTTVVNASAKVDDAALKDTGVDAATHTSNNTQLVSFSVDIKGRVTSASNSQVNVTGVTIANTNAGGTPSGSFEHAPNQKIFVSTSSPNSDVTASNGDIWYQTL
jgi:hypothetical protein